MSDPFPETRWSMILAARDGDVERSREALSVLCKAYWFPLYAYVRRRGYGEDDARDLIQAYFVYLLERRVVEIARPEVGRFRAFLLHTLRQFLSTEREREGAKKRGGGMQRMLLDTGGVEVRYAQALSETRTPEAEFERRWAMTVMERVMDRLAHEARRRGRAKVFERLRGFLIEGGRRGSYRDAAAELGVSENAVKAAVHRLRQRFGGLLRDEIAETVATPGEVDDEIRHLFAALG